jgi:hypothetical protein
MRQCGGQDDPIGGATRKAVRQRARRYVLDRPKGFVVALMLVG